MKRLHDIPCRLAYALVKENDIYRINRCAVYRRTKDGLREYDFSEWDGKIDNFIGWLFEEDIEPVKVKNLSRTPIKCDNYFCPHFYLTWKDMEGKPYTMRCILEDAHDLKQDFGPITEEMVLSEVTYRIQQYEQADQKEDL